MFRNFCLVIATLLIGTSAFAAGIVDRADVTELKLKSGKIKPRVGRDQDGHVTTLLLSNMRLSQDEFEELGKLEHLRALVLLGTNVTDEDLLHLKQCLSLDHLNLVSTEVTDRAIDTLSN